MRHNRSGQFGDVNLLPPMMLTWSITSDRVPRCPFPCSLLLWRQPVNNKLSSLISKNKQEGCCAAVPLLNSSSRRLSLFQIAASQWFALKKVKDVACDDFSLLAGGLQLSSHEPVANTNLSVPLSKPCFTTARFQPPVALSTASSCGSTYCCCCHPPTVTTIYRSWTGLEFAGRAPTSLSPFTVF